MQQDTTLSLPDELVSEARAYAASHGTTVTAIVRSHLASITSDGASPPTRDPLLAYSEGRLSRRDAIRLLEIRDYAELLVLLGEADLPLPRPSPAAIESEVRLFETLWSRS